jgi:hypothetical protein
LDDAQRTEVGKRGSRNPLGIEPLVLEEMLILDGENRVDEVLGHVGKRDRYPILYGRTVCAPDELWLEGDRAQPPSAGALQAVDAPAPPQTDGGHPARVEPVWPSTRARSRVMPG